MNVTHISYEDINGLYPNSFTKTTKFGFFRKLWNIRKLIKYFNDKKYNKILIIEENFTALYYIIALFLSSVQNKEIIVYHNDFIGINTKKQLPFTSAGYFYFTRLLEKILLCKADKIIHKGHPNELKMLPYYDKIKGTPEYLMREYVDKDKIQCYEPKNKLSYNDGYKHVVYIGSVSMDNIAFDGNIFTMYWKLKNVGCHLHVYSTKNDKKIEKACKEFEKYNDKFHFHGNIPDHDTLMRELMQYDYGSYLSSGYNLLTINHPMIITAIGNKMFDYLMARLPILYHTDMIAVDQYNALFGVGIGIDKWFDYDLTLKQQLYDQEMYNILLNNIDEALKELQDDSKLINFILKEVD